MAAGAEDLAMPVPPVQFAEEPEHGRLIEGFGHLVPRIMRPVEGDPPTVLVGHAGCRIQKFSRPTGRPTIETPRGQPWPARARARPAARVHRAARAGPAPAAGPRTRAKPTATARRTPTSWSGATSSSSIAPTPRAARRAACWTSTASTWSCGPRAGTCCGTSPSARRSCRGPGDGNRNWAFVDRIFQDAGRVAGGVGGHGGRRRGPGRVGAGPPARPAGEGVYALVRSGRRTVLAYALELPEQPGEVQQALHIEPQGRLRPGASRTPRWPRPTAWAWTRDRQGRLPRAT